MNKEDKLSDAYKRGFEFEKEYHGCAQCAVGALYEVFPELRNEDIFRAASGLAKEPVIKNFLTQPGYATAKIDVRGAVIRDGKILLVHERSDQRWCMPGGWADVGELPSEMVKREVWEESGFQVVLRKVIGLFDATRSGTPLGFYHADKVFFLCKIVGGEARPSEETTAVDFFAFDDLPPLSANRTHVRHLNGRHTLRGENRPVAFD